MNQRYFVNKSNGRRYPWSQHLANARLSYLELVTESDPTPEIEVIAKLDAVKLDAVKLDAVKLDAVDSGAPVSQLQRLMSADAP